MDFASYWQEVPDTVAHKPPFRACWEAFLRHFAEDAPYVPTLVEGAKAVQLADAAYRSVAARRWIELEPLLCSR